MKKFGPSALPLFLMGLFSQTQIRLVAFMDITEAFCYIAGPIFFMMDLNTLRKHGFGSFLMAWSLCVVGCIVASLANHSELPVFLRGIGAPVAVFCLACTFHHFLQKDFLSFKWFFLGAAISSVVSIFVFQRGTSRMVGGEDLAGDLAVQATVGYSLFWLSQCQTWLQLPIQFNWLKTPKAYAVVVSIFIGIFAIMNAGNRSMFAVSFLTLLLVCVGGKTSRAQAFFRKHFLGFLILGLAVFPVFMYGYKSMAKAGYLGEASQKKYLAQTRQGSSLMDMLRSGRSGFFIGIEAALDKPIVGFGPWARDEAGYQIDYVQRHGAEEDIKYYMERVKEGRIGLIPAHSFLIGFWVWYGILGLVCMLYMGRLYMTTLCKRLHVIPELYGYFAFALPSVLWAWLFSPFGRRTGATFLMVMCLFARAVMQGKFRYKTEQTYIK